MKLIRYIVCTALALLACRSHGAGTWVKAPSPPQNTGHFLVLPDGTVMAEADPWVNLGPGWYRLVPDSHGSYANGSWTNMAPMNFTRLDFDSLLMTNGNLFVAGGEYGNGNATAEIYNVASNTWTTLNVPTSIINPALPSQTYGNAQKFADSCAVVLADGRILIAPVEANAPGGTVIYNPTTNGWTVGPNALGGGTSQSEASWVQLPDQSILTVDQNSTISERFIPSLNKWIADASVPVSLYTFGAELGPGLLLPNGKAMFFGGTSNTAIYTPSGNTNLGSWVAGPNLPNNQSMPDGPGAMMVNGKTLLVTCQAPTNATTIWYPPLSFYEYDYLSNSFTRILGPQGSNTFNDSLWPTLLCDLPDGTVLFGHRSTDFYIYQPDGVPMTNGKPTLLSITTNANGTIHLTGKLFNGISAGASYGDDEQMDGNFPLVRFTDTNGVIRYGRTFNWSGSGVMTGNATNSTDCAIPPGASMNDNIQIVVNGFESGYNPYVESTNDSGPGTLRQLVKTLPSGSTIKFASYLSGQRISLTTGEMLITNNLTIDATSLPAGIRIDGLHTNRAFEVAGGCTVTMKGLTLTNCYIAENSGGALAISPGSSVIASNCSFLANTARGGNGQNLGAGSNGGGGGGGSGMGGAIFQNGSSLLLSGCQFVGNVAAGGNGGNGDGNSFNSDTGGQGGGPNPGAGGNGATGGTGGFGGGGGGGAGSLSTGYAGGSGGFGGGGGGGGARGGGGSGGTGGSAGSYGGAGGPALSSHSGGGGGGAGLGGAIFVQGGNVTLVNCSFTGNLATNGFGGAGSFGAGNGGSGSGVGGAVFNYSGSVDGYNLTFNNNNASSSQPNMDFSTLVVNNNDSGPGSLRQAVYNANAHAGADTVTFTNGFTGQTVHLTGGEIAIADTGGAVTIDASAAGGLTVDGSGLSRIFNIYAGASLVLDTLTITNGFQSDAGGAILNNQGTLTVRRCSFLGNHSNFAGGAVRNLFAPALMTAENCTFALNSANQEGGAILNDGGPTLVLRQCTIVSNTAFSSAAGLDFFNGIITMTGCVAALNNAPASPDVKTTSATLTVSYNLVRDGTGSGIANGVNGNQVGTGASPIEPRLGPLAYNGGVTLTMWPLGGSPAVDAGDPLFNAFGQTDQRGYSRLAGARVDIGAIETGLRTFYTFDNFSASDFFGGSVATYQGSAIGPYWNTDHRGQANSAIALNDFVGGTPYGTNNYYRISTPGDPTNSIRGLGLQGDFTVSAWVYPRIEGGYKTVVGNAGTAGLSILMGLNGGNAVFYYGGAGLVGGRSVPAGQYTHLAWTYNSQGGQLALYVNGQLDNSTTGVPGATVNTNILLGFNESLAGSYFQGFIDEFAIFDGALAPSQLATLAAPAFRADNLLPAPALSPALTNGSCAWNIVEAYSHGSDPFVFPRDLPSAEYVAWTPQLGSSTNYNSVVINRLDPDVGIGTSAPFLSTATPFACNNLTPQGLINHDDNYFVLAASMTLVISDEGDYTFGFASDDGARLRLIGGVFTNSTRLDTGNAANPAHRGDTLTYPNPTGNSSTLGVAHLKPGSYGVEFTMYEVTGATFAEVFAARGAKTALDSSFQLLSPYLFAPRPTLLLTRVSATQLQATWSPSIVCDRLQSAASLNGPWSDIPGAVSGQLLTISPAQRYYRVAH